MYLTVRGIPCLKGTELQNFADARGGSVGSFLCTVPCFGYGAFLFIRRCPMETRVAVMSIIVESPDSVEPINTLLHEYGSYIIGRMGIPYRQRGISIISIALDAPDNTISALAGRIGNLSGVSVKTAYSGVKGVSHG